MVSSSIVRQLVIEAIAPPSCVRRDTDTTTRVYGPTCPLPPWQFELTRVVKAVNAHPHSALLYYLYHPAPSWEHEAAAVRLLWDAFCRVSRVNSKRISRLTGLCYLSLQDYRSEVISGRSAHSVGRIQELCDIPGANWRRDWLPHWRELKRQLDSLDTDALVFIRFAIE